MKKLLYILIPLITCLILLAQVDDDLSQEATSLINRIDSETTSDSFIYLSGIFAKEKPSTVGKHLLEEYRKLDADESYKVIVYPETKKLELPKGDEFCKHWEDGCLSYLFSSNVNIQSLIKKHSVLVFRSNRFLDFEEYTTLSKPTIHETFPPYQYITAAERIKVLEAISVYKGGNAAEAIDYLLVQLSKLRKSMELQDSIVGKLVFLMKLSEVIDVLSIISTNEDVSVELIPKLSNSEKSFYMIAAREFGLPYYVFKNLDENPGALEIGVNFPGWTTWMTRMVLKPNMTINATAPFYYRLDHLAQLTPYDFARQVKKTSEFNPSTSKLRNYLGSALINTSHSFDKYIARFSDFDAKLAIFNQLHHLKLKRENMQNPYYGNETPKETNGRLCFSGPLEDKRFLRCLNTQI